MNKINLESKTSKMALTFYDDLIIGINGGRYLTYLGYTLELEDAIQQYKFPKCSGIYLYLESRNPSLFKKIEFYDDVKVVK